MKVSRLVLIMLFGFGTVAQSEVIYVNRHASGADTGQSWDDAYTDLQRALARAGDGDQVWVAAGTYFPTRALDRGATFALRGGVRLLGGFAGTESNEESRDWLRHRTVLSGDIGARSFAPDNSYRVVTALETERPCTLDGVQVVSAYNDQPEELGRGGGLYAVRATVNLKYCIFSNNVALGGGAVWIERGTCIIGSCEFQLNQRQAVLNYGGRVIIRGSSFVDNYGGNGGTINNQQSGHIDVMSSRFVRGTSEFDGGAYFGRGTVTFTDCLFQANRCGNYGGAAFILTGSATFRNCTITENNAGLDGGGIVSSRDGNVVEVCNSVVWGNRGFPGRIEANQLGGDGTLLVSHTCLEGWSGRYGGEGNHGLDPQFVDFDGGDYRLTAGSPCIDAGDNEAVTEPFDLDGNPRILNDVVDMGAYESVCDEVTKLKTSCKGEPGAGKLTAKLRTSLPGGSTVMLRCDDGRSTPAAIKESGRGKAKWNNQSGPVEVCPSGCPDACRSAECP